MKNLLLLIGALFISSAALSKHPVVHSEFEDFIEDEYIPCLDLYVDIYVAGSWRTREFYDGNGRRHFMIQSNYSGFYEAAEDSMSWTIPGGTFTAVQVGDWTTGPFVNINETREVAIANGPYPDLHFTHTFSGTINANNEITTLRITNSEYRCVSH